MPPRIKQRPEELQGKICAALKIGATHKIACDAVGLAESTFYKWIARGEGRHKQKKTKALVEFAEEVKKAESYGSLMRLQRIEAAAKPQTETRIVEKYDADGNLIERTKETKTVRGNLRADTWLLERRHLEHYGTSLPREIDGAGSELLECHFFMPEREEGVESHKLEGVGNVNLEE